MHLGEKAESKPSIRLVTYAELRAKLIRYTRGWPWAEDAIRDLWLLGVPVPQDRCPEGKPCKSYPRCNHIRRVLIPEMFAKWWAEVGERQAKAIGAVNVTETLGKSH